MKGWKALATRLGVSEDDVTEIDQSAPSVQQKCFSSLQRWQRSAGDDATLPILSEKLRVCRYRQLASKCTIWYYLVFTYRTCTCSLHDFPHIKCVQIGLGFFYKNFNKFFSLLFYRGYRNDCMKERIAHCCSISLNVKFNIVFIFF